MNGDALSGDCSGFEKVQDGEHGVLGVVDQRRLNGRMVKQCPEFGHIAEDIIEEVFFPPVDPQDDV